MTLNLGSGPAPGPTDGADTLQQGVLASTDFALTLNSTSSVTIAGAPAFWLRNAQGVLVRVTGLTAAITAIPVAVNNRLDQIVVDSLGVVSRIAGASDLAGNTLGTTPALRAGAGTIPAGSQLLWDILVTSAGILIANVRDRRPWARGANRRLADTNANSTASAALVVVNATTLQARIECSGTLMEVRFFPGVTYCGSASGLEYDLVVNGAELSPAQRHLIGTTVGLGNAIGWEFVPAAGSNLIAIGYLANGGGTATCDGSGTRGTTGVIREAVRPSADNGTT